MKTIKYRAWHKRLERYYNVLELDLDSRLVIVKSDKPNVMKEALRFDEVILEQWTGLYDKNGKEIYEGDCLGGIYEGLFIDWCDKCKTLTLQTIDELPLCLQCEGDIYWLEIVNDKDIEVIGNIHENKDLLNEKSLYKL